MDKLTYRCNECGREYHEKLKVCPLCGSSDIKQIGVASPPSGDISNNAGLSKPPIKTPNNNSVILKTVVLVALSIIAAMIGIFFINRGTITINPQPTSEVSPTVLESSSESTSNVTSADDMQFLATTSAISEESEIVVPSETGEKLSQVSTEPLGTTESVHTEATTRQSSNSIHKYQYVHADVSWQTAWDESIAAGGHLAWINSKEEFEYIASLLDGYSSMTINYVYLGGMRDEFMEYHWKNVDGSFFDENLASASSWYAAYWYPGEPSYSDPEQRKDGIALPEPFMSLMHVKGLWYLNDSSSDLSRDYEDGYSKGKIGYLIEFEDM